MRLGQHSVKPSGEVSRLHGSKFRGSIVQIVASRNRHDGIMARARVVGLERAGLLPGLVEASGFTGAGVAELLNVSPSAVSRWLSGKRTPSPEHAAALLKLLEAV
jgi:hypothetical protein